MCVFWFDFGTSGCKYTNLKTKKVVVLIQKKIVLLMFKNLVHYARTTKHRK